MSHSTLAEPAVRADHLRSFLDFVASQGLTTVSEARQALGSLETNLVCQAAAEGLVGRRAAGLDGAVGALDEFFLTPAGAAYVHLDPDEFPWPFRG